MCLDKASVEESPNVMTYKLVVVSYEYVMAEHQKLTSWCDTMDKIEKGTVYQKMLKRRPTCNFFVQEFEDWRTFHHIGCEYLVWDAAIQASTLQDWDMIQMTLFSLENKRTCVYLYTIPNSTDDGQHDELGLAKRFMSMTIEQSIKDAGLFLTGSGKEKEPEIVAAEIVSWDGTGTPPWASSQTSG